MPPLRDDQCDDSVAAWWSVCEDTSKGCLAAPLRTAHRCFGEGSMLKLGPRATSVVTASASFSVLRSPSDFERAPSPIGPRADPPHAPSAMRAGGERPCGGRRGGGRDGGTLE